MCLLRSWKMGFLLSAMADWLSTFSFRAPVSVPSMSVKSRASQTPWHAVPTTVMYSTSHEDRATTRCLAAYQVIVLPPRKKMSPLVLLRVSMSLPILASL
jgi:hypothetical protein